jgi:hypothetical protein
MTIVLKLASLLFVAVLAGFSCLTLAASVTPQAVNLRVLPAGKSVLSISSGSGLRKFNLSELETLGLHEVATHTFWPSDDGVYQGPMLADVLKLAGLSAQPFIRVTALDGFSQVIPREDWIHWPLLLATRRDGKPISTRNKGPLRIIYPRDMDKALENSIYRLRWVWMIESIEAVNVEAKQ